MNKQATAIDHIFDQIRKSKYGKAGFTFAITEIKGTIYEIRTIAALTAI